MVAVKGVTKCTPSVPDKLVRVTFDPTQTSVKELVKTINEKTDYQASEPKPKPARNNKKKQSTRVKT